PENHRPGEQSKDSAQPQVPTRERCAAEVSIFGQNQYTVGLQAVPIFTGKAVHHLITTSIRVESKHALRRAIETPIVAFDQGSAWPRQFSAIGSEGVQRLVIRTISPQSKQRAGAVVASGRGEPVNKTVFPFQEAFRAGTVVRRLAKLVEELIA